MPQVGLHQEDRFELPCREQQDGEVVAGSLQVEGIGEEGSSRISFEVKKSGRCHQMVTSFFLCLENHRFICGVSFS